MLRRRGVESFSEILRRRGRDLRHASPLSSNKTEQGADSSFGAFCIKEPRYGRLVPVGMSIKNAETQRLVQDLAELTGETQTAAITAAVRERLERLRSKRDRSLAERLLIIGRDCAQRLKEPFRSSEHGDLLYDDRGLPR